MADFHPSTRTRFVLLHSLVLDIDVINERQRYYLGTEALEIYQLANNLKEVFLFPSANATRLGGIVWHARHLNLTRDAMRLSTLLYRRLYNKIIVNMTDERSDGLQFKCSVKNHGDLASGWATTRLGGKYTETIDNFHLYLLLSFYLLVA